MSDKEVAHHATSKPCATLDTNGAAEYTGLAVSTLEKLRLTGAGPMFLKLGRVVRYRPAHLDEWLDARAVSSTSQTVAA
jgi:predicted DNA-binding transcriptional regulator AlpA